MKCFINNIKIQMYRRMQMNSLTLTQLVFFLNNVNRASFYNSLLYFVVKWKTNEREVTLVSTVLYTPELAPPNYGRI